MWTTADPGRAAPPPEPPGAAEPERPQGERPGRPASGAPARRPAPARQDTPRGVTGDTPRGTPGSAFDLLAKARRGLADAAALQDPAERYATAHLAALRAAAAVLAGRARPEDGRPVRRRPPRSAWELLPAAAPELAGWAALFAAGARRRAAAEAGLPGAVDAREADDLLREVEAFLDSAARLLA